MSMWKKCSLHEVAEIERDSIEASAITDGTLYVGLENIESGGSFVNVRTVANGELASNKFTFTERHVLYGKLRPYLAKIARPSFDGICSTDILPILPGPDLDRDYLTHFLRQPTMIELANSRAAGANLPRLSPKALAEFEIPLPPLAEQRRLAAILDQAEALRAKRRYALAQLDTLTQSFFFDIFGKPMVNERGWTMVKVGEAGRVQLGRQRAPQYQTGQFTRPYVRVANIFEDRIDLSDLLSMDFDDNDFLAYRLEHGDILLNEGQSTELVGRPAMWRSEVANCCFQNTLIRFQPERQRVIPEFALAVFLHYFRTGEFARISSKTSSVAHLGAGRFSAMPFPVPPLPLQHEFAAQVSAVERLKASQRASLAKLDALFASLQHRAFRGEL
jgi:type I restriction enzyme, S subunit